MIQGTMDEWEPKGKTIQKMKTLMGDMLKRSSHSPKRNSGK